MSTTESSAVLTGHSRHRSWPAHWPLTALTVGYPLWWLLGLASCMPAVAAAVMVVQLRRRGGVRLPRGFGWYGAFLVWVVLSVAAQSTIAPGAVPDAGGVGRLIVWAFGLAMYLSCGVAVVWVLSHDRRELPFVTVAIAVGWIYVWATLGGVAGMLTPNLGLRSLLELVLPRGFTANGFVRSLIHPGLADIQTVLGRAEARPKAPFRYANTWGSAIALSLPFLLVGWLRSTRRWQRLAVAPVVLVSLVPIVYSLNRGLWACLAFGVLYVVVVLARRGRFGALVAAAVLLGIAAVAFVASPLGDLVGERFANQHSNDRREQLLIDTVSATVNASPVIGFGGTRDVQGSFASIAGGSTPDCPACGVPPLGTQGHLWMLIFSHGLVGAAFFLLFLLIALVHAARSLTLPAELGTLVILFFLIQMFVYDTLGLPLMIVFVAAGLAWRDGRATGPPGSPRDLLAAVRRHRTQLVVMGLAGLAAGLGAGFLAPREFVATQYVMLIETPTHLPLALEARAPRRITVDTEASLLVAQQTLARVVPSVEGQEELRARLRISAVPSSDVLVVSLRGPDAAALGPTLDAVTQAYLETRSAYLSTRQGRVLATLYGRLADLTEETGTTDSPEIAEVVEAIDDNLLTPTQAGEAIRRDAATEVPRELPMFGASGLGIGLIVGLATGATGRSARKSSL